jgi:hypothetical protein
LQFVPFYLANILIAYDHLPDWTIIIGCIPRMRRWYDLFVYWRKLEVRTHLKHILAGCMDPLICPLMWEAETWFD